MTISKGGKMRTESHFSTNVDPYRAGIEIAEKLVEIKPEIIFLFPTIHYDGSPELVEAIYDVIDSDELVVIGNTGDGFYEKQKVADIGVSALAINSNGVITWQVAYETGVKDKPIETTKKCIAQLEARCAGTKPSLYYFSIDFRTDTTKIVNTLQDCLTAPIVGGSAADDFSMKRCFVYANREVLTDAIVMLAMIGDFSYDISIANNLQPCGACGTVTASNDTTVISIDNKPAMDFIKNLKGKPLDDIDAGILTFEVSEQGSANNEHQLRTILMPEDEGRGGSLKLYGGVKKGDSVQLIHSLPSDLVKDMEDVVKETSNLPFKPKAAIIISCTGRKHMLGGEINKEVDAVMQAFPSIEGIVGYPSLGEFGPVKNGDGYSCTLFHNMSYILLLIGDKEK